MNRYSGNDLCQLQITSKHILTPRWFSSLLFSRYKLSADFAGERRPFIIKAEAETESYDITRGQVKLGFRQKRFGKMVFLWLYSKEYLILVEDKWRNKHILEVLENLGTQEIKWKMKFTNWACQWLSEKHILLEPLTKPNNIVQRRWLPPQG